MNPLLVAIRLRQTAARGDLADAGAGRVFFVSTIGSVAGVLVTAFGLIPNLSNFASALLVAAILATLPLVLLFGTSVRVANRKPLAATAAAALAAALGLLAGADAYTGRMWPASYAGMTWQREASYRSLFGTIKVLKSEPLENGRFLRLYFQDGLIQNMVDSDNKSMSLYTYVPSKAELVDLMFDRALGAAADPDETVRGWRARMIFIARQRWILGERHPWFLDLALHRPPLVKTVWIPADIVVVVGGLMRMRSGETV